MVPFTPTRPSVHLSTRALVSVYAWVCPYIHVSAPVEFCPRAHTHPSGQACVIRAHARSRRLLPCSGVA